MLLFLSALAAIALALLGFTALSSVAITLLYPRRARPISTSYGDLHLIARGAADAPRGAVVLIHGASGNCADLDEALGARLAAEGFQVVSVDRPGHGSSDRPNSGDASSPEIQADMIREGLEKAGLREALIVAHSLGGPVALAMALQSSAFVRGLALLAPVSHPWPGGVSLYYRVAAHRWLGPPFRWLLVMPLGLLLMRAAVNGVFAPCPSPRGFIGRTRLPLVLRPWQFRANAEDVVACHAHVTRMSGNYRVIAAPTTVVIGMGDTVVLNHIHADGLMGSIAGAELVALPDVGHSPHHSAPDATLAAILALDQRAVGLANASASAPDIGGKLNVDASASTARAADSRARYSSRGTS